MRTEHRTAAAAASQRTGQVHRLQGGVFSGLGTALLDEAADRLERVRTRILGEAPVPIAVRAVTNRASGLPTSRPGPGVVVTRSAREVASDAPAVDAAVAAPAT